MALKRLPSNPVITTLALFGCIAGVAGLLRWWTQLGASTDQAFADSDGFKAWVGVAALVAVAFGGMFVSGLFALGDELAGQGAGTLVRYALGFAGFGACVFVLLRTVGSQPPGIPLSEWSHVRDTLLALGFLAAAPWVILVWRLHTTCARLRDRLRSRTSEWTRRAALRRLFRIRDQMKRAIVNLLVIVTGAVLTSGALRAALVPRYLTADQFPASAVVLYGAFFAVMLGFAVIPLLMTWRVAAVELVDATYPPGLTTSADDDAARSRLRSRLDIDGSLYRSPIALSSILAPLVTSVLAVFIPQLAGK